MALALTSFSVIGALSVSVRNLLVVDLWIPSLWAVVLVGGLRPPIGRAGRPAERPPSGEAGFALESGFFSTVTKRTPP